ncbi:MAG: hypothetical protein AAGA54_07705 [Myxococcota bacterium]
MDHFFGGAGATVEILVTSGGDMRRKRSSTHLALALIASFSTACVVVEDDDDGAGESTANGPATGGADGGDSDGGASGGDGGQGRAVRVCSGRVVCQDGGINEASQTLCMTPSEVSDFLSVLQEACIEDATAACEGIGDGTSLECSAACSEAMEPCTCTEPAAEGCEV